MYKKQKKYYICGVEDKLDIIEYTQSEHPIIIRYKEMYQKVKETLLNNNVVEFVNCKNIMGNSTLKFHFYNINQVKEEIKGELGDKMPLIFIKGFEITEGVLPINDFYTEFIKRPKIAKRIKEHRINLRNCDGFTGTFADYPLDVVREYVNERRIQGNIISYLDCPYVKKVEMERRRKEYLKLKEEFEND